MQKYSSHDKNLIKEYEKAINDYKKLVESGIIKPRGYTLATIEDNNCFSNKDSNVWAANNFQQIRFS